MASKTNEIQYSKRGGNALKRRLLSVILSFLMLFSLLAPASVWSAESEQDPSLNIDLEKILASMDPATRMQIEAQVLEKARELLEKNAADLSVEKSFVDRLGLTVDGIDSEFSREGYSQTILNKGYKDEDTVRVIVELSESSLVGYALSNSKELQSLSKVESDSIKSKIEAQQSQILKTIQTNRIPFTQKHSYMTVLNGFSGSVKVKDIARIRNLPGVNKVRIVNEYQMDMTTAIESTNAATVWKELELKGEGMLIAIIDSGIDYRHPDMKITNMEQAKIKTKAEADVLLAGKRGKWFTEKVPIGYNWADRNTEILDIGKTASMHGQHVAGISAANGLLIGVAPEAQLIAEKVFSNNEDFPSAFSDDIVAAIDHAVAVGADVINMSLGAIAGYALPDDPEHVAIKRAVDKGVIVVVSAGNSSYSTAADFFAYIEDPDIGVVGSPGLWDDTIQVAASVNRGISGSSFTVSPEIEDLPRIVYDPGSPDDHSSLDPAKVLKGEYEVVDVGLGTVGDFAGKNLNGKVALISRGSISFNEKTINAQHAGAVAAIIYNNTTGTISMALGAGTKIPSVSILQSTGLALKKLLADSDETVTVHFDGVFASNNQGVPPGDNVTDFSSWGLTPDFKFKPDIMGPGGGIYSTLNVDQYGLMSGTSMSAPHVSGAMALIAQALIELGATQDRNFVELAKTMAMNTAKVIIDTGDKTSPYTGIVSRLPKPFSPRQQGAGLIQIDQAILTPVTVVGQDGYAGVTLKDIGNVTNFSLILTNHSDKPVTYTVKDEYGVLTDHNFSGYNFTQTVPLTGAQLTFDKDTIIVPANKTATVNVKLVVPQTTRMNSFVEGFVSFIPEASDIPKLSVPYIGFYGKWDSPRILDAPRYDYDTFYGMSTLLGEIDGELYYLDNGEDDSENYISPANQDDFLDGAMPILSFLRNAAELEVQLLDAEENLLRTIAKDSYIRKNVPSASNNMRNYRYSDNWMWDGKVYDPTRGMVYAEDGQYYIDVKTRIDGTDARWQSLKFGVLVDNTAPSFEFEKGSINKNGLAKVNDGKVSVSWEATDDYEIGDAVIKGSGIAGYLVVKLQLIGAYGIAIDDIIELPADATEVTLPADHPINIYSIIPVDNVMNSTDLFDYGFIALNESVGNFGPEIHVESPEPGLLWDSDTIDVVGNVNFANNVMGYLTINGDPVDLEMNGLGFTTSFFEYQVTGLKNGRNNIRLEATDIRYKKNDPSTHEFKTEYVIPIFVDMFAPRLQPKPDQAKAFSHNGSNYLSIPFELTERGFGYKLWVNGDQVENVSYDDWTRNDAVLKTAVVTLDNELQTHVIRVVDAVGNSDVLSFTTEIVDGNVLLKGTALSIPIVEDTLLRITVSPDSISVPVGGMAAFKVYANFEHGDIDVTNVADVSIEDSEVALLDANTVIGSTVGVVTLAVEYNGMTANVDVTVTAPELVGITSNPAMVEIKKGDTLQLAIDAVLSNGGTNDVTAEAMFISNNSSIASVSNNGVVEGIRVGNTSISVVYEDHFVNVPVKVNAPSLESMIVTPDSLNLKVDESKTLEVTGNYSDGSTSNITNSATYSGYDDTTISVDKGTVTGLKAGSTEITITAGEATASITVTVEPKASPPSGGGGGIYIPAPPPGEKVGDSTVTTNNNSDGTTSATAALSSQAVKDQLGTTGDSVEVDLSAMKFDEYKDVSIILDKATADQLVASGKDLVINAGGFVITIPAAAISDFVGSHGFKIVISLSDAGTDATISIQAVQKTAIVSPVVTISNDSGKLTSAIGIALKLDKKLMTDARKVGAYQQTKDGKWAFVGANATRQDGNIVFATDQLGSYAAVEYTVAFADIDSHWAKDAIEVVAAQHITKGTGRDNFSPNATITKAEFAALLDRILGKGKEWSEYAAMNGATDVLGREEMVVMMVAALGVELSKQDTTLSFNDSGSISADSKAAVAYAVNNGLILGVDGNRFAPEDTSSRSQVATILYRLMKFLGKI